jgi:hypothetical protein
MLHRRLSGDMERLDSLGLKSAGSDNRNSFVFSIGANPEMRLPAKQPGEADAAALAVLGVLVRGLQEHGFNLTEPEFNKTGQACSSVSLPDGKMHLLLGVRRREDRALFLLPTWERLTPGKYFPSSTSTSHSERLRETINHVLADQMRAESLQRLTEREASTTWENLRR